MRLLVNGTHPLVYARCKRELQFTSEYFFGSSSSRFSAVLSLSSPSSFLIFILRSRLISEKNYRYWIHFFNIRNYYKLPNIELYLILNATLRKRDVLLNVTRWWSYLNLFPPDRPWYLVILHIHVAMISVSAFPHCSIRASALHQAHLRVRAKLTSSVNLVCSRFARAVASLRSSLAHRLLL